MGIFSKFQIKDIKTKILGGKVKNKADVPAIAVSPPTPSVQNDFKFPEEEDLDRIPDRVKISQEDGGILEPGTLCRQQSQSLPEVFDQDIAGCQSDGNVNEITISYLKLPKSGRKKRKNRKRYISCPENLSKLSNPGLDVATSCVSGNKNTNDCQSRPKQVIVNGHCTINSGKVSREEIPHLITESQEFSFVDDGQQRKLACDAVGNTLESQSIEVSHEFDSSEDVTESMDASASSLASELCESRQKTLLCTKSDQQSEKSKASDNTSLNGGIPRRVLHTERKKPETRWSLDLEKLRAGNASEGISDPNSCEMKWNNHSGKILPTDKSLISTWSLDLDKALESDSSISRAYSEINVCGSPNLRDGSKSIVCGQVMFNAKSLDLEFVKQQPEPGNIEPDSDGSLGPQVLKRGISDYVGKINGIVSKFSTWSLDIELTRKRSMEGELDDKSRAQSEMTLDAHQKETEKQGRSVSYHSLLYDFDEASRYQIYQPTVYEIGDETTGQNTERAITRHSTYGNSMKFLSKQFEHLYENGKNIYKDKQKMISNAIKQREKELKVIADREAKAKKAQMAEKSQPFFKPKPPPRRHSTKKHVKQPVILQDNTV